MTTLKRTKRIFPGRDIRFAGGRAWCFTLFLFLASGLEAAELSNVAGQPSQSAASSPGQTSQTERLVELNVATPVERELKGGMAESFLVQLKAGEFVQVIVEQQGIDVVASLFGPDGKQITRMDSPNSTQGVEPIVAIAEVAGDYRIEVRSNNTRAPSGRFSIEAIARRASNLEDRDHIAAERAFAEGQSLRTLRTADSRRAAIESFERALPYFKTARDRERQALTLLAISSSYAEYCARSQPFIPGIY